MYSKGSIAVAAALLLTACGEGGVPSASPEAFGVPQADWTLGGIPVRLIGLADAPPAGVGACPGVRPGGYVASDKGGCTFNFLFRGSDGHDYMGTAGHCILGESTITVDVGEKIWPRGGGPEARDEDGARIGEFAYAILLDPKDFALVRLEDSVAANPQMCHFGGPTGVNEALTGDPVVLQHYGNGLAVGEVLPARTAVAPTMPHPDHVFANGVAVFGDSGSGVVSEDGRAVGVLVTIGYFAAGQVGPGTQESGTIGITRIAPQVRRAEQALGVDLTLVTAPRL